MKRYPAYKDSGVEWIGKIPEGWEIRRLRYISKSVKTGTTPPSENLEYYDEGNIDWYTPGDFGESLELLSSSKKITVLAIKNRVARIFEKGTILLVGIGATLGKIALMHKQASLNQQINAIVLDERFIPKFYAYYLNSIKDIIISLSNAATLGIINQERTKQIICLVPSKNEQSTIANYLDHKTAMIDELIKKNKRLIELLKEKRQAIISHAVTKGLDPNANMKDSGIDWIGEIPEGWGVKKLKYVAEIVLGKMLQNEDSGKDELKPYMRAQNIQWEIVDITDVKEMWFSDYEIKKYRVQKGDLLISEGGEVGRTALWNGELEECYIQNSVHKVTVDKKLANNRYLLNLLKTYGKWGYFESIVNRVSIGHLTREKLKEIKIVCPPKNEQEQIVTYLDKKSSSMDETIQKIQSQIEKLKEYRQALISNVVTGKVRIDEN